MEHKPIYMDGIDVTTCSGLKYKPDGLKKPICLAGGIRGIYRSCLCKDNQNCHFKQLARKTQECEELKKEVKKWKKFLDGGICDCETKAKSEQKLKRIEEYCNEQNLKADYTACEVLQIIDEVE